MSVGNGIGAAAAFGVSTQPPFPQTNDFMSDNQSRLIAFSSIVSGLLASGDFNSEDDNIVYSDIGNDWREMGYKSRYVPSVTIAASVILEHIEFEIEGLPKEP